MKKLLLVGIVFSLLAVQGCTVRQLGISWEITKKGAQVVEKVVKKHVKQDKTKKAPSTKE